MGAAVNLPAASKHAGGFSKAFYSTCALLMAVMLSSGYFLTYQLLQGQLILYISVFSQVNVFTDDSHYCRYQPTEKCYRYV